MHFVSARIYALQIPFRNAFSHSTKTRSFSDSVIVKITADSGETGFGEAVPRPYVTGETVDSCIDHIIKELLPVLARCPFPALTVTGDLTSALAHINSILPDAGSKTALAMNASRAAVELAYIDCILRQSRLPFSALVAPRTDAITYSSVISADSLESVRGLALATDQLGLKHVKLKVGKGDDMARIAALREILGYSVSLRLDANGAFDEEGALSFIKSIEPFQIACFEQPIPRGDVSSLARIKAQSPIPIMADESLVTEKDSMDLIAHNACDYFNLRISKNGGIYQSMHLIEIARNAGIGVQFGCLVGETAILSAAQRHLAAHYPEIAFVEGSFGTYLLEKDIAREPVMFGKAGKAPLLTGPGSGIDVCEDTLERYSTNVFDTYIG
jgi:muconate cycloisomerase